ncbi:hypothetical protein E8A74_06050 [Polyangium fumosum]|uniref:Uncharacterized protein n=1 Tax=Polyangium fumosum TaxID=889272 RepID=A0A4U1JK14_9BACT|nr:hypothetical protein E8A74_06050 [Polyangium fumosum]
MVNETGPRISSCPPEPPAPPMPPPPMPPLPPLPPIPPLPPAPPLPAGFVVPEVVDEPSEQPVAKAASGRLIRNAIESRLFARKRMASSSCDERGRIDEDRAGARAAKEGRGAAIRQPSDRIVRPRERSSRRRRSASRRQ